MKTLLKKYLAWLPAVSIAIAIFMFSAQPADASTVTSDRTSQVLLYFANKLNIIDLEQENLEYLCEIMSAPVRKSAHMLEFAALDLSILFALFFWDMRGKKLLLTALGMTVLYACSDELHQLFVPGRAGMIRDVLIDSVGPVVITGGIGLSGKYRGSRYKARISANN